MIESIFNTPPQSKKSEEKINNNLEAKEKRENSWLYKFKLGFAKYITKPIFEGYGKLEYAKPLLILQNHKAEIARNREASKMLSPEQGGPTKEEIYASALALAKKLGWKEKAPIKNEAESEITEKIDSEPLEIKENKIPYSPETSIPLFITKKLRQDLKSFDVTDEEIDKLKPAEAWDLLQQKTLSKEIKEPKEEKIYTTEQVGEDFSILQKMWEEAYDRMDSVNEDKRKIEILDITAKTFDDPKLLEDYLQSEQQNLKPEEKFFIEMSIQIKKFRQKTKELLVEGGGENRTISKEEYDLFVRTGEISQEVLGKIADKIAKGSSFTNEELSIYSDKASEIEKMLNGMVEV
jgi:hypothetical protein